MIDKLLRIKDVIEATGKSRSGIYADMAVGNFPKSIPIGAKSVAWPTSVIESWINEKINSARTA